MQAEREEAAQTRSRLHKDMDSAMAAQQERAATWQAKLQAEEARLSELAGRLQVLREGPQILNFGRKMMTSLPNSSTSKIYMFFWRASRI